jgi:O-antigen/teichoic acid export membrane protein
LIEGTGPEAMSRSAHGEASRIPVNGFEADAEAGTGPNEFAPQVVARASRFQPLRRKGALRVGWGIADQAISSLTNFAVTVTVARSLGAENFGAFTLAFVTYSFALNASKGLTSDPLVVRFSASGPAEWRRAVAQASGTALVVGVILGLCLIAIALPLGGSARGAFFALGLTTPGLLLQDSWRYAFFAAGRGKQSFLNDLIWALALIPALALTHLTGHRDAFWYVLAWGLAATVAAVAGMAQTRVIPRPSSARQWLRQHRDLGPRYLMEGTASSIATQLRAYGAGIILGLAAVGYVQGAITLMGPIMIVLFGSSTVMVPELARVIRRAPGLLAVACLGFSLALATAAMAWGAVLLVAMPHGLGDLLLGDVWTGSYPLVLFATLTVVAGSLQAGAGAGLRSLGAARRSLRAMLISQSLVVLLSVVGAAAIGAKGVMAGSMGAATIGACIWWAQLYTAIREAGLPQANVLARLAQLLRSRSRIQA